ncbi:MAG: hypothetical protein WCP97_04315 [bacterium]
MFRIVKNIFTWILSFFLIAAVAGLLGFLLMQSNQEQARLTTENTILSAINRKLLGNETILNLRESVSFQFEKAYIFPPYTSQNTIITALGFDSKENTGIEKRDDVNLVIFVEKNNKTKYVLFPRSYGDFFQNQQDKRFISDVTLFKIVRNEGGSLQLLPEGATPDQQPVS